MGDRGCLVNKTDATRYKPDFTSTCYAPLTVGSTKLAALCQHREAGFSAGYWNGRDFYCTMKMFFYIEIIYFSHKCSLDLFEILCKENALLNSLQHRQVLDCIWRNLGMWGDKQKEGLAGEGEKPRQADGVNSRESEVNEGRAGRGERENMCLTWIWLLGSHWVRPLFTSPVSWWCKLKNKS